jgi:RNA polymerase sigma-70 factor (ECF subfamily)
MFEASPTSTSVSLLRNIRQFPPDDAAWRTLVDRYAPRIHGWCRRWNLSEADAEEVTQIVLVKLSEKMRSFDYRPELGFRKWLKTVTHHAWQDYLASRRRPGRGSGESDVHAMLESIQGRDSLMEMLKETFDLEVLEEAMARIRERIEPKSWDAFRLLAFDEKSGREVAAELAMSVPAVFMAKKRVQAMIAAEIKKLDAEEA